ncbi:PREDICTED: TMV resistance protein N-like [Lupinus angustifolius]|uniref:TMV resistance protein N-like n=1 Tax=Lupinus angustifolius TaxID=3871 RepID=UPI00092E27A0|nr:PREDICTED: TMV resistance protein N-like [Lupinus angustifolius]
MSQGIGARVPLPILKYDVFLSFRGEDTRQFFTTKLHARLQQKGLATFIDNERLMRGDFISQGLLRAIEESLVSVVILSKNYASSTWCLDELQKIIELRKEFGRAIFPVFYGVDPSEVRHQRGSFEVAFGKYEEVYKGNREKVRRWRDALADVANTSGWDSREYNHDAELIQAIVEAVWINLRPKIPYVFPILESEKLIR